jgi:hypothetical protein
MLKEPHLRALVGDMRSASYLIRTFLTRLEAHEPDNQIFEISNGGQ